MVGFKRTALIKGPEAMSVGDSVNIVVGALLDIKQKVLGDGIRANHLLPAGESALRFKETSQVGKDFKDRLAAVEICARDYQPEVRK